jgi:hypothetical protein
MICPFCREETIDDAVKCKHCGSMLGPAQEKSGQTKPLPIDIPAQIEALNISSKLKSKLYIVHDIYLGSGILFPKIKKWYSKLFNIPAFFFPVICYMIKGMWRKSIIFLCMHLIISTIIFCLYNGRFSGLSVLPCVLASLFIYIDIYRKEILKQKFWW